MNSAKHFTLMAKYNQRMNQQFTRAAGKLTRSALTLDRGVKHSSVMGTLNYLMVSDLFWLWRFSQAHSGAPSMLLSGLSKFPVPITFEDQLFVDFNLYAQQRPKLDELILTWTENELSEHVFMQLLTYSDTKGSGSRRHYGELIAHFFNQQTYYRGQLSALFSQLGVEIENPEFLHDLPSIKPEMLAL